MLQGGCFCGRIRYEVAGHPFHEANCHCSICRRSGALWGYDFENEKLTVSGPTQVYMWNRKWLEFHFFPQCASWAYWRAVKARPDGRRHMGFNLRLANDPAAVQDIALVHHDTETRDDLPGDGKCVADVWA